MRLILIPVMCLVSSCSVALTESAPARPGQPPPPDLGVTSPRLYSPELDILASRPGRPPWAPLDGLWGHTQMVPSLLKALDAPDPSDRARAAFVLGQTGSPAARPALFTACHDQDRTVRVHAGIALAYSGDERGLPAARAALISEPTWVRFYAIMGLWRLRKPEAWTPLSQSLPAQPQFLATVIQAALSTPASLPGGVELPGAAAPPPGLANSAAIWESVAESFVSEADWWWHTGDYDQAIRCLQTILFLQPDLVETYSDVAWLQWSSGYNAEAIGTYHRGIAANPNDPEAYFNLGFHYHNTHKYSPALIYLKQAVALGGRSIMRHVYAHALEKSGQVAASLAEWEQMLHDSPQDPLARLNYERLRKLSTQESEQ